MPLKVASSLSAYLSKRFGFTGAPSPTRGAPLSGRQMIITALGLTFEELQHVGQGGASERFVNVPLGQRDYLGLELSLGGVLGSSH